MARFVPESNDHSYTRSLNAIAYDMRAMRSLGRTMALFGPWGSGKTTFLDELAARTASKEHGERRVVLHHFDAWQHQYSPDILLTMFAELLQPQPDPKKPWYADLILAPEGKGIIKGLLGLTGSLTNAAGKALGMGTIQDFVGDYTHFQKALQDQMDRQCRAHNEIRVAEYRRAETLKTISHYILKAFGLNADQGDRLVMVVDNLDRCPPETLLLVLEFLEKTKSVSSTTGLGGVHFLLPLDYAATEKAVRSRYSAFSAEDAEAYVEKVFFPIYRMPRFDGASVAKCLALDDDIAQTIDLINSRELLPKTKPADFGDVANLLMDANPRKARRLVHTTFHWMERLPNAYRAIAKELGTRTSIMMIALLEFYSDFANLLIERRADVMNAATETEIAKLVSRARNESLAVGEFANAVESKPQLLSVFSDLRRQHKNAAQYSNALGKSITLLQGLLRLGALQDR